MRAPIVRTSLVATCVVTALASVALAADASRPHRPYDDLKLPPLRPFTVPKPAEKQLPGGARLFVMEDHELPLVDLVVVLPGGTLLETRDKAGLAAIWSEVVRSGGSERIDGDALDALLESEGASIGVSAGEDKVTFTLSALKEDFPRLLEVFASLIETPRFPEDKLELSRKQHLSAIARRNDDPSAIAGREFRRALYGDDTPYGWTEEPDTIRGIVRGDLIAYHAKILEGRALIGVVGDVDTAAVSELVAQRLGWLQGKRRHVTAPEPKPRPARVYLVDKPEVNQSTIVLGHLGIRRRADDPGYFAAVVMNAVLGGGGFSSRLLQRVRTEMGLAYSTYSYFEAPYHRRGSFRAVCQTKCESTLKATRAIVAEIERIRNEPVSEQELAVAKESILQKLVFASEKRANVLERAMRYAFNDFPPDYLERFQKGIAAVTAQQVQQAARRLLHPDRLTFVVVGNASAFDGDLSELGELVRLDVEKPAWTAPKKKVQVRPEQVAAAREIIRKAIEARGGLEALEKLACVQLEGQGILHTPQGEVPLSTRTTVLFPDRVRIELMSPVFGRIVQCYDGKSGWLQGPMGVVDMPPSEAKRLREQAAQDPSRLLRRLLEPDARPVLRGEREIDGRSAWVIDVGAGRTLLIDKESHALVEIDEQRPEGTVVTRLGDYRKVGAVMLPHRIRTLAGGKERVRLQIDKARVNPTLPGDFFQRPPAKRRPEVGAPQGAGK